VGRSIFLHLFVGEDVLETLKKPKPNDANKTTVEEQVKAGNIGGIGLSEVSAATIRKAAAVTKIVCVGTELSLWTLDILNNGVAKTCAE
jgi:pyridoxine 4-dehydrogenase